jgi:nitrate reductase NapD
MANVPAQDELHIASLVVHCAPRRVEAVAAMVAGLADAQVHATSPDGKLVVTLEAQTADEMADAVAGIQRIDGVLSAALVYQCADSLAAMNEEIDEC